MKNFDAARKALDNMANSAGNADKEMAVIQQSLEYKLNALREAGTGIAQNLFKRDDMKMVVDGATAVLNIIDALTEKLGLFGTIGAGVGITALIKNFSTLKSLISSTMGDAIKSVNSVRGIIDGATNMLNPSSVNAYVAALQGLDATQARVALSTTTLNAAQQQQVLVAAGLVASEDAITTALAAEAMTEAGLSSETIALVAEKAGLSASSDICTASALREALATQGIVGADAEAVMANLGLTASNVATGVSFEALAASAKAAAAAIGSFLLTNPIGWAIMAAGAIFATVKIVDALTESFDEACEKAEESRSAYESTKEELTNLNSELETTKSKIAELEGKTSLTFTEEQELARLKHQNDLLENQIQIKERLAASEQKQAAKDANNVLTKKSSEFTGYDNYGNPIYEAYDIIQKTSAAQEELNQKRSAYNDLSKEYQELAAKHKNDKEDHGGWFEETQWEKDEKQLEAYEQQLGNYEKTIDSLDKQVTENLGIISENSEMLYDSQGNVIEGYEDTARAVEELYGVTLDSADATDQMANSSENAGSAIQDYSDTITTLKENVSEFKSIQENLNKALSESASATGLSQEGIDSVSAAFKDLQGYDPAKLFEATANGVHLNTQEFEKLNSQLETQKLKEYSDAITDIQKAIYSERAKGNDTSALEAELSQAKLLKSEYEGLTSAYNKWVTAKSGGNERDSYESVGKSFKDMQNILNEGWYGDESLNAYLDLLLSASQRSNDAAADFKKLSQTIEGTSHSILDYWKYDGDGNLVTDGLFDFLDDVNKKMGDSFAKINEDGKYEFDFDGDKLQQVADAFGMSTEAVELFERAMIDAGMAVDMGDLGLVEQIDKAKESLKELQEAGKISDTINLDFDVDKDPIEDVRKTIDDLKSERLKIDAETNPEAAKQLDDLIAKCEEQYYFRLNAETDGQLDTACNLVERMKALTAAPLSVETKVANAAEVESLATELAALPPEVQIAVGIKTENIGSVDGIVNQLNTNPKSINVPVNYQKGSEPEKVDDATGTANYELGDSPKTVPDASGKANFTLGSYPTRLPTLTQTIVAKKVGFAAGTAHAEGTTNAYAKGTDWTIQRDEIALVNEVGTESIVRNGRWFPIPGGAHTEPLKKGDIVFNAAQTAELVRTGKVLSGGGHGKAYADGSAWVSAYDSGSGGSRRTSTSVASSLSTKATASSNSKYTAPSSSSSSSSKSYKKDDDKFEELFDFVEIAINRIGEAIDRVKVKAESAFKTFTKRNSAIADEIALVSQKIDVENSAYSKYMQQANAVGLSETYAKKVRDGSIDVSKITDEGLADKIKDYQDFYEKAIEAKDAVAELHEEIASLYKDRFDNVADKYSGDLSLLEHLTNSYNNDMELMEKKGYLGSKVFYEALSKVEHENIATLQDELEDLKQSYSDAMNSGEIEEGSEAWYEMQQSINSVKEEIQESTIALQEYANEMHQLDWDYFDKMEERISTLTDEADFFIELMSNKDMFDDNGNLTDVGLATMGMHGQNYNVFMAQADQYAEEIVKLNKEIADNPYDYALIERREKLLDLQREAILSAENEKYAIKDLVEDGIKVELDSLKELIDTYNKSLDRAKDLYDYQKKVKNQTSEIATLQKQLSAYKNDTSEENRARLQKIQVDLSKAFEELEETEYEKYISDQKKLLDDLYSEYETILNQRLDDVDALISDMIDTINGNSATISETISDEASNVGYTITKGMSDIWANEEGSAYRTISFYAGKFLESNTSVLNAVNGIKAYTDMLKAKADAEAAAKVAAAQKTTQASKPTTSTTTNNKPTTNTQTTTAKPARSEQDNYGVALAIWNGNYGWGTGQDRINKLTAKGFDASHVQAIVNQMGKDGYVYSGAWVGKYYGIRDISPYHYNKYAKGLKKAKKDENAWVNELGTESIVSPSDNAIITHIAKGSSVLDDEATQRIWDMANDPSDFIGRNLIGYNGISRSMTGNMENCNNSFEITMSFPDVSNYEDFMRRMQRDPNAERMIQDMTVGRLGGGSKFAKNKYRF